jgi:hypothetical protein
VDCLNPRCFLLKKKGFIGVKVTRQRPTNNNTRYMRVHVSKSTGDFRPFQSASHFQHFLFYLILLLLPPSSNPYSARPFFYPARSPRRHRRRHPPVHRCVITRSEPKPDPQTCTQLHPHPPQSLSHATLRPMLTVPCLPLRPSVPRNRAPLASLFPPIPSLIPSQSMGNMG